ncbi:hypothetical protein AAG570_004347 [Ranatra chinensis]|uniref:Amino acid transporter transmembrane domain-containing protein n=1 Tax=Ranatra chinensis TaxID=642074 RepID=A0ABD0YIT6_9HEMI
MFAMGDAFKHAGIVGGPVLTFILGIICIYNNHVLVNCSNLMRDRRKMDKGPNFPVTVEMCFEEGPDSFKRWSNLARKSVKAFVIITQLGFCCVYFVFVSSTIKYVVDPHNLILDVRVWMVIVFVPIVMSCMVRSLKYLAPISLGSNLCVCTALLLTLYISFQDLPDASSRPLFAHWTNLPLFFGTTIYAFEGISLVLPLQNEMKNTRRFGTTFGVLNLGMSVVTTLLILVGFVGYLKYGDGVQGSLSLNLPKNDPLSDSVQAMLALGIASTFALQFYVASDLIWQDVKARFGPFSRPLTWEILLRFMLVLFTMLLAAVIPMLGLFISLIGAVSSTALALVFPALSDMALRCAPPANGPLKSKHHFFRLSIDAVTLIVAFVGFVSGTYCSISQIVHAFQTGEDQGGH